MQWGCWCQDPKFSTQIKDPVKMNKFKLRVPTINLGCSTWHDVCIWHVPLPRTKNPERRLKSSAQNNHHISREYIYRLLWTTGPSISAFFQVSQLSSCFCVGEHPFQHSSDVIKCCIISSKASNQGSHYWHIQPISLQHEYQLFMITFISVPRVSPFDLQRYLTVNY